MYPSTYPVIILFTIIHEIESWTIVRKLQESCFTVVSYLYNLFQDITVVLTADSNTKENKPIFQQVFNFFDYNSEVLFFIFFVIMGTVSHVNYNYLLLFRCFFDKIFGSRKCSTEIRIFCFSLDEI